MRLLRLDRAKAGPAIAVIATFAIGLAAFGYTVDDAFVLARYAQRLARGLGWTFDDGPPTDGVTGPLGVLPGLVAALAGLDPVIASKLTGLACGATAAALAARAATRHALGGPSALLVAVLASCNASLPIWSVAGLETGMATLATTIASLAAIARPRPRGVPLGLALAALAWLRPELAVLAIALLAWSALRDRREAAIATALALAGALSILAARQLAFGSPLPLSFSAKPGDLAIGASYLARATIVITGLTGLALAWLGARRSRSLRALAVALAVQAIAIAIAGGDWMPGFRLFAPLVPSYALVAGIGGARAVSLSRARRRGMAISLVAIAIAVPSLDALVQLPRARDAGETRERVGRPLALWLARIAGGAPVALVDVGYLPFTGGFAVVDLAGITDPAIGLLPGRHMDKEVSPALLEARGVRVIVLRSFAPPRVDAQDDIASLAGEPVERRLAASPWVRAHFRVERVVAWSAAYHYVVLVRDETRQP